MTKHISLRQYVKKRTGVPLGGAGSLSAMLKRSLGAPSFYAFWRYWNPIWGYYLSRYIMKPFAAILPNWCAVIITFAVSGALHDVAVMLIKVKLIFFFTPWFTLMGLCVLLSHGLRLKFSASPWFVRALFNLCVIGGSFYITELLV